MQSDVLKSLDTGVSVYRYVIPEIQPQGIAAIAAAAAAAWVWRQPAGVPVRGAALVTATLLATPFYFDYDLVLLALPIAWLGWDGYRGGYLSWEKSLLAFAWIWPLIARQSAQLLGVSLTPVVLAGLLALSVRRAAMAGARHGLNSKSAATATSGG